MALVEGMCVRARTRASPSPSPITSQPYQGSDTLLMGSI